MASERMLRVSVIEVDARIAHHSHTMIGLQAQRLLARSVDSLSGMTGHGIFSLCI